MTRAVSLLFHDVYVADPAESGFVSDAADRYKLPVEDFDAQLAAIAALGLDAPVLIDGRGESGGREEETISAPLRSLRLSSSLRPQPSLPWLLTFDDGGASYHSLIADRLESRGWRGHCFVSTDFIGRFGFLDAAQIRDLDARGHVIGSHSASHPARFSACAFDQMVREWRDSRLRLEDLLGHPVHAGSVPGGYFSPAVARAAAEAGLTVLFTSEPVTAVDDGGDIALIGRFTIRQGDDADASRRLLSTAPWARSAAWISWNAKAVVKPLLGPAYSRVADRVFALRRSAPALASNGRRGRS